MSCRLIQCIDVWVCRFCILVLHVSAMLHINIVVDVVWCVVNVVFAYFLIVATSSFCVALAVFMYYFVVVVWIFWGYIVICWCC